MSTSTAARQVYEHTVQEDRRPSGWHLPPTEMVSSIEEANKIIDQEIGNAVRTLKSLPESVSALTNMINNEFGKTADLCRNNAQVLRKIASDLDARADRLDKAAPEVAASIEEWTAYENETQDAMVKLGVLLRR